MFPDTRDLELLRDLAGDTEPPSSTTSASSRAALLRAAHSASPETGRRRRLGPAKLTVALVGVLAVATPIAIGQLGDDHQVSATAGILCADSATAEPSGSALRSDGRPAAQQCADVEGVPPQQLTACDSTAGGVYVYRAAADVCARLGLRRLAAQATPAPPGAAVLALRAALVARISERCMTVTEAKQIVMSELAKHSLVGWTITATPTTTSKVCLGIGINYQTRTVSLFAI